LAVQHVRKTPYQTVEGLEPKTQSQLQRNFEAVTAQLVPVGTILPWGGQSSVEVPSGYLACNGAIKLRAEFPALFSVIGTAFNLAGEAATEFRLPFLADDRYIRGSAAAGATAGSNGATMPAHSHGILTHTSNHTFNATSTQTATQSSNHTHGFATQHSHVNENGVVFTGCISSHNHNGGAGQLSSASSNAGCEVFGPNASTTTVTVAGDTGGQSVNHFHQVDHTHSLQAHDSHVIPSEGGTGDNQPQYVSVRFIIKT